MTLSGDLIEKLGEKVNIEKRGERTRFSYSDNPGLAYSSDNLVKARIKAAFRISCTGSNGKSLKAQFKFDIKGTSVNGSFVIDDDSTYPGKDGKKASEKKIKSVSIILLFI